MQKTVKFGNFLGFAGFIFVLKDLERLRSFKKIAELKFEEN